jgi:3-dehydroquinate synthase
VITTEYLFSFGSRESRVYIREKLPLPEELYGTLSGGKVLAVCDANTEYLAKRLGTGNREIPRCVLPPGEEKKTWESVERILRDARAAGMGRDGLIIGVGGGVITDMAGFAASVYMRGVRLRLISTTLLGMADASVGGKTGIDFPGVKNLIGAFYPAEAVYMPLESLSTLPPREWKSGFAEVIKTAILAGDGEMFSRIRSFRGICLKGMPDGDGPGGIPPDDLGYLISRTVEIKGRIVEEDPAETGERRALLNLGHTFGHALETSAGLGRLTHGEAVAWGIARACELGHALGITPLGQALEIRELIRSCGYISEAPHPAMKNADGYFRALGEDKKKKAGKLIFIVPAGGSAQKTAVDPEDSRSRALLRSIINGEYHF